MNRVILHIDLDYFYAQLEELRNPSLKGKPLVVCIFSGRTQDSGAVASANYLARELGVRAGMPIVFAKKKAPQAAYLRADREYYEQVSDRIMEILRLFAEKFEQESIDEASLEITQKISGSFIDAKKVGQEIKQKIFEEEKLTCSVGIGPNKLIAKMAADTKKPDGLTVVAFPEVDTFLRSKKISDLYGIGEKTTEALAEKGVRTISQLAKFPIRDLQEMFGEKRGKQIHEKSLGIDNSEVEEKPPQQLSRIMTLKENSSSADALIENSSALCADLAQKAKNLNLAFRTVSIILISNKLETISRSKTLSAPARSSEEILKTGSELFVEFFEQNTDFICRRFGIRVSNFEEPEAQRTLFEF